MKMSGRYSPGLYAGVTGILGIVFINAFTIPSSLELAQKRDRIAADAQLEQTKAEQSKKIAQAYSKNAIATFDQLIINDYVLTNTPPRIDWQRSVDSSKKTYIFDRNRLCIGYAEGGTFFFIKYYQGVCNENHK